MKKKVTNKIEGQTFDKDVFNEAGVFIIRNAIPQNIILTIQNEWTQFYTKLNEENQGRILDKNNFVNFADNLPENLDKFYKSDAVVKIAKEVIGDNVALYNHRIVMKDKKSDHKVFLHQDFCYHLGFPQKCNVFIPVFDCGVNEGGMTYHLGSHQYGYLGDAGEINPEKFVKWEKVTPELKAGDVVVMNSLTWHESGPNISDNNRVLFDTIIQPSNDPSGIDLIAGEWETDFWIEDRRNKDFLIDSLFVNCRTKKIKNLLQSQ